MKLYIKNMVCSRCLKVIKQELKSLGVKVESLELGILIINDKKTVFKKKFYITLKKYCIPIILK